MSRFMHVMVAWFREKVVSPYMREVSNLQTLSDIEI
jgi:hypothetical protein